MNRVLSPVDERISRLLEIVGDARTALQTLPIPTVESFGVRVRLRPDSIVAGYCTVSGTYFHNPPRIAVAETPTQRRIAFTVLHEFAHHLLRGSYEFSSLARNPHLEEELCDSFAAEILVPSALLDEVMTSEPPTSQEICDLYRRSYGSGAVCARRVSERLTTSGYVVVAVENEITYAFSVDMLVDIERHVAQQPESLFSAASRVGAASGVTQLVCRPGHMTAPLMGDVVRGDDNLTFGVFQEISEDSVVGRTRSSDPDHRSRVENGA
jgi:hypothetical protein